MVVSVSTRRNSTAALGSDMDYGMIIKMFGLGSSSAASTCSIMAAATHSFVCPLDFAKFNNVFPHI